MRELIDTQHLKRLVEQADWNAILQATDTSLLQLPLSSAQCFFRGLAFLRLNHFSEALECINIGLIHDPASEWGNQLVFETHLAAGDSSQGFHRFRQFIEGTTGREPQKAWYVQKASELSLFQIAGEMNETRRVIVDARKRPAYAIGLQCFAKADTLAQTFAHLTKLHNAKDYGLIIIIDSCNESGLDQKHIRGNADVRDLVAAAIPDLLMSFFSVEILQNETNLGTAPTCRRLLDHVTKSYDGFLFIEDDCLLAPSALDWTAHHLNNTINILGPWFVSCESIFFDKKGRSLNPSQYTKLSNFALQPKILGAYHLLDFVPSTCFGTTSAVWKLCSNVRSFTRGPESLSRFMASMGRKTVSPMVPRASDIGMMHDLGYSVTLMGRDKVREAKDTYLMPEDRFVPGESNHFLGNIDLFYSATSLLNTEHLLKCGDAYTNKLI